MRVLLAVILLAFPVLSFAQGNGQVCLVRDENTTCNFPTMDKCNQAVMRMGGYCQENYRLYGNVGTRRYCVASRYGLDCRYRTRPQCVQRARRLGADSGCVENWLLSPDDRATQEEVDAELEDFGVGCIDDACE